MAIAGAQTAPSSGTKCSPLFLGAALIAAAIYLKPASGYQAVYGDGYVYVVDLNKKNIDNIIQGKTAHP